MPSRRIRAQRRAFAAMIARLDAQLRAALEAGAADLRSGAAWADLLAALERQDIEGAIAALRIEPAAYARYAQAKASAFAEAGALTAATIPAVGGLPGIRWDMTNPAAEAWIRQNVGQRITEMVSGQVETVRETILTGYQAGRHPHAIALDVGGRVVNGVRQGGVIGLDAERARRLNIVTRGMETAEGVRDLVVIGRDGVPRVRYAVNRATEQRILRAYNAGGAVSEADRAISVRQYANALLKSRAETVARTETAQAVSGARQEQWRQFMRGRNIPPEAIVKRWLHGGGVKDPRPHHVAANGMTVRGLDTPFVLENGAVMLHPHDPSGGGAENINCTCSYEVFVDQTYGLDG
jgi:hypothetical protein